MQNVILTGVTLDELISRISHLIDAKIGVLPKTESKQPDYISRKEVASLLKITLQTLHDWTKYDYLKKYKIGSRVLYKKSEVIEALEKVSSFKHKKGGLSHVN